MKSLLLLLCSALLLAYTPFAQAQIGQWSAPINVSNTPRYSIKPDMAIDPDGRIHVVWLDNSRLLSYGDYDVLYSVYSENSCTWSAPVQLSPMESTYSGDSRIAIDSLGHPHVVWTHRNLYPDADIYYSELTDSGWTAPLNLTPVGVGRSPDIAIDQRGFIHVVWNQVIGGVWNINHSYCKNGMWSNPINASNSSIDVSQPRLVEGLGNELHLVWKRPTSGGNSDIYYAKYDGFSWGVGQNVSNNPETVSIDPNLAVDPQGLPHVVWTEYLNPNVWEIYYSYFDGLTWSAAENISNQQVLSMYPCIAVNFQNLCCVLFTRQVQSGQPDQNFYTLKQGNHWTTPDSVFNNGQGSDPSIEIDHSGVFHSCQVIDIGWYCDIGYTQYFMDDPIRNLNLSIDHSLLNIYPNPFNLNTLITFKLPTLINTAINIYNIQGCLIKSLYPSQICNGSQELIWDGKNNAGIRLSSGVYFLKLQIDNQTVIKNIYLVK